MSSSTRRESLTARASNRSNAARGAVIGRAALTTIFGWKKIQLSANVMSISASRIDRKSTRLNSSHSQISYAVFCLKKKKTHVSENRDSTSMNHIQSHTLHAFFSSAETISLRHDVPHY